MAILQDFLPQLDPWVLAAILYRGKYSEIVGGYECYVVRNHIDANELIWLNRLSHAMK